MPDEDIARQVQQGDVEAFGILMNRYEPKLTRYGRKFLADEEHITDLVQDVFIKTYTNIQQFDASRRFSPWIYRVAHNVFVNALVKRGRERLVPFDLDTLLPHLSAKETADEATHRDELRSMLDDCLGQISSKYREILVLYYFEELEYKEIAEVLHIPIATVGVRLQRARKELTKVFAEAHPNYEQ